MTTRIIAVDRKTGREICPECFGSGFVDPWAEDADYPCPLCRADEYRSADEYFEVADALAADGMSRARLERAEKSHLQERPFTERQIDLERTERKRAAGW